ncbi:transposase [Xanthovirga aplysinae]|uniref:transposase n=1 Tax=Xanthovirga aplysinae TaxID=2529853 RepID=UPI0012BBEEF5|nr:hypothetical protein [Xanthovirga aplysinae]
MEKECKQNIEFTWLLKGLSLDHNTINNFEKKIQKLLRGYFSRPYRSLVTLS